MYCAERYLVIEVNGDCHDVQGQGNRILKRTDEWKKKLLLQDEAVDRVEFVFLSDLEGLTQEQSVSRLEGQLGLSKGEALARQKEDSETQMGKGPKYRRKQNAKEHSTCGSSASKRRRDED